MLFGGSAGGGKSDSILMAALQYFDVPGYSALILRRTYSDLALAGALMSRAHEWLANSGARWDGKNNRWNSPEGASLQFGYLEHEHDKYRYQSSEFQCICFDELTQFSETQYAYMFSRLRKRVGLDLPLRMRAASNPGGIGHAWVKQRFLVEGRKFKRVFMPARLRDNPSLDQTGYVANLQNLDPVTRAQLLEGNWDASFEGAVFDRSRIEVVDQIPAGAHMTVRAWDLAASTNGKRTAGVKMSRLFSGHWVVEHVVAGKWLPHDRDKVIRQVAVSDGPAVRVLIEQEPGSGGLSQIDSLTRLLVGYRVIPRAASGDKVVRAGPVASMVGAHNVLVVRGEWNSLFFDELTSFPNGEYMDQVDALAHAFNYLAEHKFNVDPVENKMEKDVRDTRDEQEGRMVERNAFDDYKPRGFDWSYVSGNL